MSRKRIQLMPGSIRPAEREPWHSAGEKIAQAGQAINRMRAAKNRVHYEEAWTEFVDAIQEFWVRFYDEGKNNFGKRFMPWAGKIEQTRKSEPLLKYLIKARNKSQHGRLSLNWDNEKLLIAPGYNGGIRSLAIFPDGTYEMDCVPAHSAVPEAEIVHDPGRASLPRLFDKRTGETIECPTTFTGSDLNDTSPVGVAQIALSYYLRIYEDARRTFKH